MPPCLIRRILNPMSATTRTVRIAACAFLLIAFCFSAAVAQGMQAQIELSPASVLLPAPSNSPSVPQGAKLWALVRNLSKSKMSAIRLSWLDMDGISLAPQQKGPQELLPGQEFIYPFLATQAKPGMLSGTIPLRVDYQMEGVPRVVVASLAVKTQDSESANQVLDVQVKTALESLQTHYTGSIYLVLTNKLNTPVTVESILPHFLPFIDFGLLQNGTFTQKTAFAPLRPTFAPHETQTVEIDVSARDRVQQGKHLLIFDVPVQWTEEGVTETRTLVAAQPVSIGILGESAILTVLTIPTFLVVPGFLMVGMAGLFWRWRLWRRDDDPAAFDLEPTKADFWLVALPLAFVAGWLYSLLIHNLLDGYGFNDIVAMWAGCVLATFGVYSFVMSRRNAKLQQAQDALANRTPAFQDTPVVILQKLANQGLTLTRPQVQLFGNGPTAFALQPDLNAREVWVSPRIEFEWVGDINQKIDTAINKARDANDAGALAAAFQQGLELKDAQQNLTLTVRWQSQEPLSGVIRVKKSEMQAQGAEDKMV